MTEIQKNQLENERLIETLLEISKILDDEGRIAKNPYFYAEACGKACGMAMRILKGVGRIK